MNDFMRIPFDLFGKRSAPVAELYGEYPLAAFTSQEIAGMLRVRSAVTLGRYSESTQEFRRLMFARWLVKHGRLDG
jgi:hypothetical protein